MVGTSVLARGMSDTKVKLLPGKNGKVLKFLF
jgi:hypothetical protein